MGAMDMVNKEAKREGNMILDNNTVFAKPNDDGCCITIDDGTSITRSLGNRFSEVENDIIVFKDMVRSDLEQRPTRNQFVSFDTMNTITSQYLENESMIRGDSFYRGLLLTDVLSQCSHIKVMMHKDIDRDEYTFLSKLFVAMDYHCILDIDQLMEELQLVRFENGYADGPTMDDAYAYRYRAIMSPDLLHPFNCDKSFRYVIYHDFVKQLEKEINQLSLILMGLSLKDKFRYRRLYHATKKVLKILEMGESTTN